MDTAVICQKGHSLDQTLISYNLETIGRSGLISQESELSPSLIEDFSFGQYNGVLAVFILAAIDDDVKALMPLLKLEDSETFILFSRSPKVKKAAEKEGINVFVFENKVKTVTGKKSSEHSQFINADFEVRFNAVASELDNIKKKDFIGLVTDSNIRCRETLLKSVSASSDLYNSTGSEIIGYLYARGTINQYDVTDALPLFTQHRVYSNDEPTRSELITINKDLYNLKNNSVFIKKVDDTTKVVGIVCSCDSVVDAYQLCTHNYQDYLIEIEVTVSPIVFEVIRLIETGRK